MDLPCPTTDNGGEYAVDHGADTIDHSYAGDGADDDTVDDAAHHDDHVHINVDHDHHEHHVAALRILAGVGSVP